MSQLIPFSSGNVPAHIGKRRAQNVDLFAGIGPKITKLSIKGKVWTIVKGKDNREIITNPNDPDSPAAYLPLVIVKAAKDLSRAYFEKSFDDNAPDVRPTCSSIDGVKPDAGVPAPQAKSCAACKWSVFKTATNGKGPRCGNHRRLAVVLNNRWDEPMLLQVPGASLDNLAKYGKELSQHGASYDEVIAKVSFDMAEATPKIVFKPANYLTPELCDKIQALAVSSAVADILGLTASELEGDEIPFVPEPGIPEPEVAAALAEEPPRGRGRPKKIVEPAPEPEDDEEDEAPAASNVTPIAPAKSQAPASSGGSFDDWLDNIN